MHKSTALFLIALLSAGADPVASEDKPPALHLPSIKGNPPPEALPELEARRIGHVLKLGLNGELIFVTNQCPLGADFAVARVEDGLVLRYSEFVAGEDGKKRYAPIDFAAIKKDGRIELRETNRFCYEVHLEAFPETWPFVTNETPVMPEKNTIIARKYISDEDLSPMPSAAVGWLALLALPGGVAMGAPEMAAPENVLWIVPLNERGDLADGFKLVHSGPRHEGVYMTVDADLRITLGDGAINIGDYKGNDLWPYVDFESGSPILPPDLSCFKLIGHPKGLRIVYKHGKVVGASTDLMYR